MCCVLPKLLYQTDSNHFLLVSNSHNCLLFHYILSLFTDLVGENTCGKFLAKIAIYVGKMPLFFLAIFPYGNLPRDQIFTKKSLSTQWQIALLCLLKFNFKILYLTWCGHPQGRSQWELDGRSALISPSTTATRFRCFHNQPINQFDQSNMFHLIFNNLYVNITTDHNISSRKKR